MIHIADPVDPDLYPRTEVVQEVLRDLKMRKFLKRTETLHCGVPTAARDNKQSSSGAANPVIIY